MKKLNRVLSLILALAMIISMCPGMSLTAFAAETVSPITGGETISANGSYQVTEGSTGTITVAEGVTKVTIIGSGAQWDQDPASATYGAVTSPGYTGLMIDCAAAPGVTLTLKDIFISNSFIGDNTIDFAGTGNTLIFDGTVVIDHDNNAQGYAGIHVKKGDSLNIYGTTGSSFYMYKREQAAGIGANNQEACGTITFGTEGGANDFWFYMKGTKQGAVIGNGANCPETPGDITFYSGIYNMVANARGALIGGSAGPSSFDAGNVYIQGGLLNLNVDFSGASIGGGGFATGNDKEGGNVYMIGGSVRPYIDTNAISSWSSYGVTEAGVDDVTITANKLNADGAPVYMMAVDTTGMDADTYTIQVDGQTYYTGSRYAYCYCYENTDRDVDSNVYPNGTPGNWISLTSENNFYLFVTGEDHVVTVNGEDTTYAWDAATETFTAQADEEEPTEEPTETPVVSNDVTLTVGTVTGGMGAIAKVPVTVDGEIADLGITSVELSGNYENFYNNHMSFADAYCVTTQDATLELTYTVNSGSAGGATSMQADWNATITANEGATLTSGDLLELAFLVGSNQGWVTDGEEFAVTVTSAVFKDAEGNKIDTNVTYVDGGVVVDYDYAFPITIAEGEHGSITRIYYNNNGTQTELTEYKSSLGNIWVMLDTKADEGWVFAGLTITNTLTGEIMLEKAMTYGAFGMGEIKTGYGPMTFTPQFAQEHTITVEGVGGTCTPSYSVTTAGNWIFLNSPTPDDGYTSNWVATVEYTDPTTGELVVINCDPSNNYFIMPDADVVIKIVFEKEVITYAWYEAGTETASYTISTAEELAQLAAIVNGTDENYAQDNFSGKTVSLAGDIVLAEDGLYTATENVTYGSSSWPMTTTQYVISAEAPVWTPIGSGSASGNTVSSTANAFAGTFDGQGYTVSGIYTGTTDSTTANTATVQGLFGIVTGTVKNVTVSGCVTGRSVVGGVVAYLNGGTVENCVNNAIVFADGGTTPNGGSENGTSRAGATGGIVGLAAGTGSVTGCTNNAAVICANTAKGGRVGGIVGLIDQSGDAIAISKCVNNGAVEGYQYVAGICGMNYAKNSPIDRCVNTANITMHGGGKAHAGGIAGQFDCQITNCYNTGNIHATHTTSQEPRYFGGIAGDYNYSTGNGKIINCYTTGTVTYDFGSARDTGIIVGESGYAVNSYFLDEALTGSGSAVAQFDGISRTVSDMYYNATFVLKLGEAYRYDANKINNGYPVLDWQGGDEVRSVEIVVEGAADQITFSKEIPMGFRYTGTPTTCMIKPTVAEGYAITNIAWTENCGNAYISEKSGYLFIEKCTGDVTVTVTVEKVVVNYTVTLTEGENYTIAPVDGYTTTVEAGSEFKFTVTAADGYSITEVKAGDAVLTADENDVYSITVDADVVVTVTAEKIRAPYVITTAEELLLLAEEVNAGETKVGETYTLGNDIDLSTVCSEELGTWNAIGGAAEKIILDINSQEELNEKLEQYNIIYDDTGWSYKYGTDKNLPYDENRTYYAVEGKIFSGTFDGAGYTIENLYVLSETGYAGLFGNVDGTLKNFTVKGSVTTATGSTEVDFVGGVTGKLSEGGRIENVISYVDVDASAKAYNVGGITGFCGTKNATASNKFSSAENTFIIECVNYGSVYGWSQVGGIAGENAGQILRCANYGDVDGLKSGSKAGIGGIAGRNGCNNTAYTAGTVIDCYNFGTIATSDNKWCGGIVGFNNAESEVRNCYNVGTVNGTGQANAICGQNEGTGDNGVYNCWYLDSTKVFDESGVYGGKYADCGPKTEAEMKDPVFAAILGESFHVDTDLINEGYPVLKFQGGSAAPAIYTVTIPAKGEGYTVSVADGYTTTVVEGGEFKFSVYLLEGYEIVSVKAGDTELTAMNGVYTIADIQSDVTVTIEVRALPAVTLGDVNGDGVIDNTDAMLVMQYTVGTKVENLNLDACDVNDDGVIDNTDAMLIMQLAVGTITEFPVQS